MPHLSIFSARLRHEVYGKLTKNAELPPIYAQQRLMRVLHSSTAISCRIYVLQRRYASSLIPLPCRIVFTPTHVPRRTTFSNPRPQIAPPRPNPHMDRLNPEYRPIYELGISWLLLCRSRRGRPVRLHAASPPLQMPTLQTLQYSYCLLPRSSSPSAAVAGYCLKPENRRVEC